MKIASYHSSENWKDFFVKIDHIDKNVLDQILILFIPKEKNQYIQALFVSFLLYITKNEEQLAAVVNRMAQIGQSSYINDQAEEIFFHLCGSQPDHNKAEEQILNHIHNNIQPQIENLKKIVDDISAGLIDLIRDSFYQFYHKVKEELFLAELQIHTEELQDPELEKEAIRWEYMLLNESSISKEEIRKIYLKRQDECLKSN